MIEEIKIVSKFKYIAKSKYKKLYNISHLIKEYYKNIHDWNIIKNNINIFIYLYINKIISFIIDINDFSLF